MMNDILFKIKELKEAGKTIVFTNGVFDILHKGHVDYLNEASSYGDYLIVGINSDSSVKRLGKGDDRPINSEFDRAFIIQNLKSVSDTIIFDEDTPLKLIEKLIPDVLVKGGDYDKDETDPDNKRYIVGSDIVLKNGGKVVTVDLTVGKSSTNVIEKIKKNNYMGLNVKF